MKIVNTLIETNKWTKLISGTLVCVIIFMLFNYFDLDEYEITKKLLMLFALPGAYVLIGLLEVVSGVPFKDISGEWDSLAGWQRGVLGVVIVILASLFIFSGIIIFVI